MPRKLSVIGVGAFGAFMVPHLRPHFRISAYDPARDVADLAGRLGVTAVSFEDAADADVVVLAPPVQEIEAVARRLAPLLRPGTLVLDVCSVKLQPLSILADALPAGVDIVGTHPLFGPQSGKHGIAGQNIAVCEVRGGKGGCVAQFLRDKLALTVTETTAEEHDRQMAYVQGLTHLLSRIVVEMDVPDLTLTTKTFEHLRTMVETVRYDSDLLFRAIENRNPFVGAVKNKFFASAAVVEKRLRTQRWEGGA